MWLRTPVQGSTWFATCWSQENASGSDLTSQWATAVGIFPPGFATLWRRRPFVRSAPRAEKSVYRRERSRQHESVLLFHHDAGRIARRPLAGRGGFVAHAGPLVGVLVGPDVHPFVQCTELRIHPGDQRREFRAALDLFRPALDQAGDGAGDQRVLADLEQRADLARRQRRRERRGVEHLALLVGDEFADRRRPAFVLRRRGAHRGALLEAVVGPDMDDLVQRADVGVPEGGQFGVFFADWQRRAEAFFDLGQSAG